MSKHKRKVIILGFLTLIDFLYTWYGVNVLETITELNPLVNLIIHFDFLKAVFLRLILTAPSILILYKIEEYRAEKAVNICLMLNILVNIKHLYWLGIYTFL